MSNNPLQRISDLEAQVAALTAENSSLKSRTNGNGNGHFDADKLLEAIGQRIDRSGNLLPEDFTGKFAGLIAPYIDKTLRECAEVAERQDEMEKSPTIKSLSPAAPPRWKPRSSDCARRRRKIGRRSETSSRKTSAG